MFRLIKGNGYLLGRLIKKDIEQKYKGSILGLLWSVLVPIFMLIVYTYFFSEIFQAKWGGEVSDKYWFAMVLFCGLSSFNMISEVMNRATSLIPSHVNYVKKVVFPLELLPVMITMSALFNAVISYIVLMIAELILYKKIPVTIFLIFPAFLPLIILCIGIGLFISAVSVYLKDVANAISVIVTVLMYISPVFFSLDVVPESFRFVCSCNPLTYIIENFRNVVLYGNNLNILYFLFSMIYSVVFFVLGWVVFERTKEGFADIL